MQRKRQRTLLSASVVIASALAGMIVDRACAGDAGPAGLLGVARATELRIAAETSGRLLAVHVAPGRQVRKGELLAELSTPELAAAVLQAKAAAAQALARRADVYAGIRKEVVARAARDVEITESNLLLARQQLQRIDKLVSSKAVSRQLLDEASAAVRKSEARLAAARAALEEDKAGPTAELRAIADANVALAEAATARLEAKLRKTGIVAPADGFVRVVVASPGEIIAAGQPVVTIETTNGIWFSFTIREDRLDGIDIGAPVHIASVDGNLDGHVTEMRPLGEFATWRAARAVGDHDLNSFFVRVDADAAAVTIAPGMSVWLSR